MKKLVRIFLFTGVVSSALMMGGCIKSPNLIKSVVIAGVGLASAVLGDQFGISKRIGIPKRKRTKKNNDIFISAPESVSISSVNQDDIQDNLSSDFTDFSDN